MTRTAIVTGASRGIGRGIALRLAAEGYDVALVARSADTLQDVAKEVGAAGRRAVPLALDLRQADAGDRAVAGAVEALGGVDLLVNNAGATKRGDFFSLTEEDFQDGFALKFHGAVRMTRAAWPHLKAAGGAMVNIIGVGARNPSPDFTIGGSVNAACANFAKAMAQIGTRDGVRVNAVHPGLVRTDRLMVWVRQAMEKDGLDEASVLARMAADSETTRIGEVEDIAALVAFLASPEASFIHGSIVDIDGGRTRGM
ncbi:SDR family oxidoreductase [Marinibaculum pumilum]|uniref:SDR family oxidoreductase n=1 Tax=Marinibaculum pumilum TaxID=1766165 RepID=A0ABV7L6B2_9PROT